MRRPVHIGDKKYPSHFIEEFNFYFAKIQPFVEKLIRGEKDKFNFIFNVKKFSNMLISEFILFSTGVCP